MSETEQALPSWQPTVEFYKGDPRANEIRTVCLGVLEKMRKLLGDPEVMENREVQQNLYAVLELDEGRLIELGVKPRMHVGKPLSFFQSSPLHAAQFVAGQLMQKTGEDLTSEKDIVPLVEEFSEERFNEGEIIVIKSRNMPDKVTDFAINTGILWAAEKMLAVPENYQE